MSNQNANAFYNNISEKYDWFFSSWEGIMERQMSELVPILQGHGVKSVLDCACGTGLQAIGLAKEGYSVVGSDLSKGMIEKAWQNANNAGISIKLIESDFRELNTIIPDKFDAVMCMGNSIPHLITETDVKKALCSMSNCLYDKGLIVIEMRDYDELIATKRRFMPIRVNSQKGDNLITIIYVLDYLESIITFNVVYIIQDMKTGQSKIEVESVDYNPIQSHDFVKWLSEVGFKDIRLERTDGHVLYYAIKKD